MNAITQPATYATAAAAALQASARQAYRTVHTAGSAYAGVYARAVQTQDLVETMRHMVELALAAEHLAAMAADAEKAARAALAEQMAETGAAQIQTEAHTAFLSKRPAVVSIDQEELVPPSYWRQPEPVIDRKAVKRALENSEPVAGCSLIRPNEPTLTIRARKG